MPEGELSISEIEESILQLLWEKERLESGKADKDISVVQLGKRKVLESIIEPLTFFVDLYTRRTGKTLEEFLKNRAEEKAKLRERTYI